jgi:hypothetical protein
LIILNQRGAQTTESDIATEDAEKTGGGGTFFALSDDGGQIEEVCGSDMREKELA